jgi:hypothetical protein
MRGTKTQTMKDERTLNVGVRSRPSYDFASLGHLLPQGEKG